MPFWALPSIDFTDIVMVISTNIWINILDHKHSQIDYLLATAYVPQPSNTWVCLHMCVCLKSKGIFNVRSKKKKEDLLFPLVPIFIVRRILVWDSGSGLSLHSAMTTRRSSRSTYSRKSSLTTQLPGAFSCTETITLRFCTIRFNTLSP